MANVGLSERSARVRIDGGKEYEGDFYNIPVIIKRSKEFGTWRNEDQGQKNKGKMSPKVEISISFITSDKA